MLSLLISLFAVSNFAVADSPATLTPLITKLNASGFVMDGYQATEKCEVYQEGVVVTTEMKLVGSDKPVIMKRVHKAHLSPNIRQLIANASKEEFRVSDIQVCDASTTLIEAQAPNVAKFPIFRSGTCSAARAERVGPASFHLRSIVDSFCPETNDPGGDL